MKSRFGVAILTLSLANMVAAAELPPLECVALLRQARVAAVSGDAAKELALLKKAGDRFPDEMAPLHALLDHHTRSPLDPTVLKEVQDQILKRLEREPPPPLGVLRLFRLGQEVDRSTLEAIAAHLEKRSQKAPDDHQVLSHLGYVLVRLKKEAEATIVLEQLHKLKPPRGIDWPLYHAYVRAGRFADATLLIGQGIDTDVWMRPRYIALLGKAGKKEEQVKQAEIYLAELALPQTLGNQPDMPALPQRDSFVSSEADLLEQRINNSNELVVIAWDLYDAGQNALAERYFRRALEFHPENEAARKPVLHLFASDQERAALAAEQKEFWQKAEDPVALFQEGTRLFSAGDVQGAFPLLKKAMTSMEYRNTEAAWYNLGMAAYKLEQWRDAADALVKAGKLNSNRPQSALFAGLALVKLNRCAEAVPQLERALRLDPSKVTAHHHLGDCYLKLGNVPEGLKHRELYRRSQGKN